VQANQPDLSSHVIRAYLNWLSTKKRDIKSGTLGDYRRRLEELARFAASRGRALEDLTEDDLVAFLFDMRDERGTQSSRYAAIRGFYGWRLKIGKRPDNPAAELRPPKIPKAGPRARPGRVAERIARLGEKDQRIVQFLRSANHVGLGDAFRIKEDPPVGEVLYVRGRAQPILLNQRARTILDSLGGSLTMKFRTFQRHLEQVGLTARQLRLSSRATVEVELTPRLEELVHTKVAHEDFESAAKDAFIEVEERLRELVGSEAYGSRLISLTFGERGVLAGTFERDKDRESLERLFLGASDFRNQITHHHVLFDDPMYAREVLLLADLLLRIVDEVSKGQGNR
jgi:uncharacterized protein (TIGR02391 family)